MTPSTWGIKPGEKKIYEADTSPSLSAGDTVKTLAVKFYNADGVECSELITGLTCGSSTSIVKWFVNAGTLEDGDNLWMKITITTAKGESIKEEVKIKVREKFTV